MVLAMDYGNGIRFWTRKLFHENTSDDLKFSSANYEHNFEQILENDYKLLHVKWKDQMTKKGMTCGTYFTCE